MLISSSHFSIADHSAILLQRWARPIWPLPLLENLPAYIEAPLAEDAKIPISQELWASLLLQKEPRWICSQDVIQRLFRLSETEQAEHIWTIVNPAFTFAPPDNDGTKSSFHSLWDRNIRQMLEAVILQGKVFRDSNEHTSTGLFRPDFGLLVAGNCSFRGEEKAPGYSGKHPKDELIDKLTWTYDPAPYILG